MKKAMMKGERCSCARDPMMNVAMSWVFCRSMQRVGPGVPKTSRQALGRVFEGALTM